MKIFAKRAAIICGVLFAALLCMGIVYIDNVQTYWRMSSTLVQLIVSNTVSTITVNTNWPQGFGFNSNNTTRSWIVQGFQPSAQTSGNGLTAATVGGVIVSAGTGGTTTDPTTASGGAGGTHTIVGGAGGVASSATTNATGGNGGALNLNGGIGGGGATVATNASTGGNGGNAVFNSGDGGTPSGTAATNVVGGNAGNINGNGGSGGSPSVGWARKGGNGGGFNLTGGAGGSGVRTNGGNGGSTTLTAGGAGSAGTGGNAGSAGTLNFIGGAGASGNAPGTNSNGGNVHALGGSPGSSASPGDVILARDSSGNARGGLMVGPALAGAAALTNILGAAADLNFPSTAAGTVSDLGITVTGVVSNNCAVALSVPWECATNGGSYATFNSNDTVYVRFVNNNLITAIDPPSGTFTVIAFRIR